MKQIALTLFILCTLFACNSGTVVKTPVLPITPTSVVSSQTIPATIFPTLTGKLSSGTTNLQTTLNTFSCGDEIVLTAGQTYSGNFVIPNKNCTQWTIIRSSGTTLAKGTRVTADNVGNMATICTPNSNSAIENDQTSTLTWAVSHIWFEGIQIMPCSGNVGTVWNAVLFDMPTGLIMPVGPPENSNIAFMPHDIVFSHCYIHGVPNTDGQIRGLFLDGYNYSILDSTINNWQSTFKDAQGISVDCSTGNFLIQNNDIEGSANSVLFAAPECALTPTNIMVKNNYFSKPTSWNGVYITKNLFEVKNGNNITIDTNTFLGGYNGAQPGGGILLTPRTWTLPEPPGTWASSTQVSNVTITNNIMTGVGEGIVDAAYDSYCTPAMNCIKSQNLTVKNNVIITGVTGAPNYCLQLDETVNLIFDHNNCIAPNTMLTNLLFVDTYPVTNLKITNNIFSADIGGQGIEGPLAFIQNPNGLWGSAANEGGLLENNAFFGNYASYDFTNFWMPFPANVIGNISLVSSPFVANSSTVLLPNSPLLKAATDKTNIGYNSVK